MRPIKFRAWDGKRFSYIQYSGNILSWANPNYLTSHISNSEQISFPTLMDGIQQFTGLLDKNGVSIYEGDILRRKTNPYPFRTVRGSKRRRRVNDKTGGWAYKTVAWIETSRMTGWDIASPNRYEVIGNIYDNPRIRSY